MEDAEVAVVALSGIAGTARWAAMQLREQGLKVGVLRPRVYRPFPAQQVIDLLKNVKAVAVVEKASSPGATSAPMFADLAAAMSSVEQKPKMVNFVTGLGGRDTSSAQYAAIFQRLQEIANGAPVGPLVSYVGVRE
jgi:pyruvate ferredoxin oxidoreductase alpha subunit